ncbi:MAG: serine/threonine protein kinase [Lachnospiraceae bacterium]|nr:serine/threonine protein kinase [Lachnospiraceae bacterium]
MTDDLKTKCEKSFYSELYHFDETSQGLLIDNTTRRLYLKKTLDTYDISVYAWLKEHHSMHIPDIHSYWEEDGHLTVIEEYVQGTTLDVLMKENALSCTNKLRIVSDICDALSFLHSAPHPIIHRDIKASNIMLTNDMVVKLIDYDAAKTFHPDKGRDTTLIGTVGSAAPEQYGFAQSDARTDIYSLGVLIREMFPDDSRFSQIVSKATQMEPKLRYQSAEELKRALRSLENKPASHRDTHFRIRLILILSPLLCLLFTIFFACIAISRMQLSRPTEDQKATEKQADAEKQTNTEKLANAEKQADTEKLANAEKQADTSETAACDQTDAPLYDDATGISSHLSDQDGSDYTLEITDSYWYLTPSGSSDPTVPSESYISYGAIITNPSDTMVAEYPLLRTTARNSSGDVIGTDESGGNYIMPKDSVALSFVFPIPSEYTSSDITVEFDTTASDYISAQGYAEPSCSDFEISGVSFHKSDLFPHVTGEIAYTSDLPVDGIKLTAVLRNGGKIVDMEFTFLENLNKNKPTPFTIDLTSGKKRIDEVEVYAEKWH